jgi:DNA-binding PadR family transcriptional regulator
LQLLHKRDNCWLGLLEKSFHGFYAPSHGVVYPTLQMLEETGYVTSAEQDARRVYTITEQGIALLLAGGGSGRC